MFSELIINSSIIKTTSKTNQLVPLKLNTTGKHYDVFLRQKKYPSGQRRVPGNISPGAPVSI